MVSRGKSQNYLSGKRPGWTQVRRWTRASRFGFCQIPREKLRQLGAAGARLQHAEVWVFDFSTLGRQLSFSLRLALTVFARKEAAGGRLDVSQLVVCIK